jgi:hypothetical protein
MNVVGVISVLALMAPTFAVFASIVAELAIEVQGLITLEGELSITLPTLLLSLQLEALLALALTLAVTLGLPKLSLTIAFNAELALLLGIVLAIKAVLAFGAVAGLQMLTYGGPGSSLGAAVAGSGVFTSAPVTAVAIGATSSAAFAALDWLFPGYSFGGLNVVGAVTLAVACSGVFSLLVALGTEYGARYSAELKASASLSFVPPAFAGDVTVVAGIAAKIRAAIALHMPEVGAKLLAALKIKLAALAALLAQINAAVSFGTDGFDVLTYQGPGSGLGGALSSSLASGWPDGASSSAPSQVVILAATTPEATAALRGFFVGAF